VEIGGYLFGFFLAWAYFTFSKLAKGKYQTRKGQRMAVLVLCFTLGGAGYSGYLAFYKKMLIGIDSKSSSRLAGRIVKNFSGILSGRKDILILIFRLRYSLFPQLPMAMNSLFRS
jgi:hypothetical protein